MLLSLCVEMQWRILVHLVHEEWIFLQVLKYPTISASVKSIQRESRLQGKHRGIED